MKKRRVSPLAVHHTAYPERDRAPADPSRRRFLRQVAVGAGLAGLASTGAKLASAQEGGFEIDFSILDEHDSLEVAPVAQVRRRGRSEDPTDLVRAEAPARSDEGSGAGTEDRAFGDGSDDIHQQVADADLISENRALWVDPAYLVLVKWTRPTDDETPIVALEGAASTVAAVLDGLGVDTDALHDVERLHEIERAVLNALEPIVAPATIEVVHLDHDCSVVCAVEPEIMVRGRIASPGR